MLKTKPQQKDLSTLPCTSLRGVGPQLAEKLSNIGINNVQDILFHLPLRYQDRTRVHPIAHITPGEHVVIEGNIENISTPFGGKTRFLCHLRDPSGKINLRFFHINALQKQSLILGTRLRCFGEVRRGPQGLEMVHPEYRVLTNETFTGVEENLTPIYPATDGLSQLMLRKLTNQALSLLANGAALRDILPNTLLEKFSYPALKDALAYVHRPPADAPVDMLLENEHITQKRLVFEELLAHRLSLLDLKTQFQTHHAYGLAKPATLIQNFLQQLPFPLTTAQQRVAHEIQADLTKPYPMLRLVQGDVGSGKTVVAALAVLQGVENGYQCAVLAPTELLVEQHYRTFQTWLQPLNISVVMLSGQMKASQRQETLSQINNGQAKVILGTHALFQKGVEFANLALIVVDEQHRFGVQQRAALREKGIRGQFSPHQLIMTATPIPRTLAMSVYADLDYSVIDELPPGRTPVQTIVISNARREEILLRIRESCGSGRQAYWVCTLIEESDLLQCQAAENTAAELHAIFPELKIGLIHGRMKASEKESIMADFKNGNLHLLVATTVIEVGVDVPNASLMIIENAERLGLAQLHQLRGRVGRGTVASHCVLMYQAPLSQLAKQRLTVMRETTDGFKIAQRDLEIRGPGEVLGTRQTGDIALRIADLLRDSDLLPAVQEASTTLLNHYPDIIPLLIKRWLRNNTQYRHV